LLNDYTGRTAKIRRVCSGSNTYLKVIEFNDQEIIWHYTSGDALLGIVETGTLYATQVSCLNDSTEIRYAARLVRDAFMNVRSDTEEESRFLERIVKATVEEPAAPTNLPSAWFVTCFSKEKHDLSQWRAYSGGENGYAIAFLARPLSDEEVSSPASIMRKTSTSGWRRT
jgi:hypothetical protein